MSKFVNTYTITKEDRALIVAALRTLANDSPRHFAKAGALAAHIESAEILVSDRK